MKWKYIGSTFNDSFILNGIDIFKEDWVSTGTKVEVKDPQYGEIKTFTVWEISKKGDNKIRFIAGEFSNNVWGIYTEQ